jgi:hypothetical protein
MMAETKAKMSVQRALTKKKSYPVEIIRTKRQTPFIVANRNTNTKINGISIEDVKKNILAANDSTTDMRKQYHNTLTAIALSNSTTKVKIGGVDYTVTEAIQMKKVFEVERQCLELMKSDFRQATAKVNSENETVALRAAEFAKQNAGGDKTNPAKPEAIQALIDLYTKANEYSLIDPLGLEGLIQKLESEIVAFESEVDAELSESNAINQVEI